MSGPESRRMEQRSPSDAKSSYVGSRYRILEKLGSGAMGDVFLAEDTKLQRRVAIKSIRADRLSNELILQRIKRECLLHAKLGAHANIVTLFDLVDEDGQLLLIMEYVKGETLESLMERYEKEGKRVPIEESLSVTIQCLSALAHTHAQGIIHRDVKPANIILVPEDGGGHCVKVMDFGIARLETDDPDATTFTRPGERSPGTPLYMAPEQIDSATYGIVTPSADVYATGVMLYHLVAGQPPFRGTLTDIFNGHLNFKPKPISLPSGEAANRELMDVIVKAMNKMPDERFASAGAFEKELKGLLQSGSFHERPARLGVGASGKGKPVWRRPLPALAVVGAMILALVWAGVFGSGKSGISNPAAKDVAKETVVAEGPKPVTLPELTGGADAPDLGVSTTVDEPDLGISTTVDEPDLGAPTTEEELVEPFQLDDSQEPEAPPVLETDVAEAEPETVALEIVEENEDDVSDLTGDIGAEPTGAYNPPDDVEEISESPGAEEMSLAADEAVETSEDAQEKIYVVEAGDTIFKIAQQLGIDKTDLVKWNLLENPNDLGVGQVLYLYERPGLPDIEIDWEDPSWSQRTYRNVKDKFRKWRGGKKKQK